jgi:hypothetical protein
MLHCNIALAASGVNSQMSDARRGGFCELAMVPLLYNVEIA